MMNKETYLIGETMSISISGINGAGGTKAYFGFILKNPSGTTVKSQQYWYKAFTDTVGYTLLPNDPTGTWTALVTYNVLGAKGKITTTTMATDTAVVSTPPKPDLAAVDIWTDPALPIAGLPVTIFYQISTNAVPFTQTIYTYLYIDSYLTDSIPLAGSTGANTYTYSYLAALDAGNHELKMITDSTNVLTESSETNNQVIKTIAWQSLDIAVVDIWTDPVQPIGGQPATIYYQISTDTVPFTQTVYTDFYIDGIKVDTKPLAGSTGAATYTYSYTTDSTHPPLPTGNHELKVITDSTDAVIESDQYLVTDTDNQRIEVINWQAPPLPDLAAVDIWTAPASPTGGQSATIYYQISTNSVPFTPTVFTDLYIDGIWKAYGELAGSSGAATYTYSYTTTLASGNHELKMITEADNVLIESSETNNERIETINWQVPTYPDLIPYDMWTSPIAPIAGQSATIYAQVKNVGNKDIVSTSFMNRFYVDGSQPAEQTLTSLAMGALGPAWSAARTVGPGYHAILTFTDVGSTVVESDEGNNQLSKSIWWASPDLIVTSITVYNEVTGTVITSVYSGWPIRIDVVVKNNGDTAAGASTLELQDILSGVTTVMGTASIGALAAGASTTWSFTGKYLSATGTHTIRAVADKNGAVAEANKFTGIGIGTGETNNNLDKTNFVVSLSSWTAAIYMDSDEYLDESATPPTLLESWAVGDIDEMKLAGTLYGSLNIIVMLDMFDGEGIYPADAGVYIIQQGSVYQIADLGEVNMGDPATLNSFLTTYSIGRFKASQSMMVLWDHGGGAVGGIFSDQHIPVGTDNSMSLPEMETALRSSAHIDILAFHACLMSSLEVGFQASSNGAGNGDIVVGFEDVAYADGFPYGCSAPYTDGIFNYMRTNPTASEVTVAYEMVDRTYRSYQSGGSQDAANDYDTYLSIGAYYNYYGAPGSLDDIAYELSVNVGYILYDNALWGDAHWARDHCDDVASPVGGGWGSAWQGMYVDVYDFVQILGAITSNLGLKSSCNRVITELSLACINYKAGSEHQNPYGGISVYFPMSAYDRNLYGPTYDALAMSHVYGFWDTFINMYPYP